MRAAVINAFIAGIMMIDHSALGQGAHGALLRQAAQIALMHAMGTIACATFMNMGASSAARVPLLFVLGTVFYSVPVYLSWPPGESLDIVRFVGAVCLALGRVTLLLSTSQVDRGAAGPTIANQGTAQ
ncbi:hypothetical protein [Sphingomonas endolithica]|uniref:hypothetical protein n=1 Tax=Sphingomonas endolithica TaxID=2972485 RepID=UPI0021AED921|nr:hypothetical protein [Sphingomonas sp. ZFBP2030]